MNITNYTIEELHDLLVKKEVTAQEVVKAVFARINETEEKIGAFITLTEAEALEQAREIDAAGIDPTNILSGIPIGIKDNIITNGTRTTAASKILEDFVPVYDATVTKKLKEANMITVGKLNMDEFAMGGSTETSYYHKTHNPWNLDKVPGGSSGGSAAAVAAGQIPVSLGTDTADRSVNRQLLTESLV